MVKRPCHLKEACLPEDQIVKCLFYFNFISNEMLLNCPIYFTEHFKESKLTGDVYMMKSLPKTKVGKVRRNILQDMLR